LLPEDCAVASNLLETVISSMTMYNDWAKQTELAEHRAQVLEQRLHNDPHSLIGAFDDDVLMGVVTSSLEAGLIWLGWIVVSPEQRGRGVARALMLALEDSAGARGAHKIWCDSRIENDISKALLEASDYRIAAKLERHWYGLDYFIWEKRL
jgi:ribosomal protein S18 acetylase RimI-like enzyme